MPAAEPVRLSNPPVLLDQLAPSDLGRLTFGLYFIFWGTLLTLAALCELLTTSSFRLLDDLLLGAGAIGFLIGAWRLHQVRALGDSWRRRTREALIAGALLVYLVPFFLMWRRIPVNLYLLCHGMALIGIFNYSLALMCQVMGILGRAAGRRSFVIQAITLGTISVLLLFPPFGFLAQIILVTARVGGDPFALLQLWLQRTPVWLVFVLLLPFPLTLSLVWAAKDVVLCRLLSASDKD